MKTGDIILIPFPLAEMMNTKVRPAAKYQLQKTNTKILLFVLSAQ